VRSRTGKRLLAAVLLLALVRPAGAATLPDGFQESVVLDGLNAPTAVRFAADGRIFVAEKRGIVKVFDGPGDGSATVFADLRTNVHNHIDRGLLGLALHPDFPDTPWVYVLYTADADVGGTPPKWGQPGANTDPCPTPPGSFDGCVVSARLSRLTASGDHMTGSEKILLENWCQQFPSHSIGALRFGSDGALYVSGGDGGSYTFADYGQRGFPEPNACGDPPAGFGGEQDPATSLGGSLRSQNLGMAGYGRAAFGGKILRVDPATGEALEDNPLFGSAVPGADRIVASGFRNPYRFAFRPRTDEMWIGDVGWVDFEEIDRFTPSSSAVPNFGWPCYEGVPPQSAWEAIEAGVCEALYDDPDAVVRPRFAYSRHEDVVPGESCDSDESSISGLAFYDGGDYPSSYDDALFFADYSRGCIWSVFPGLDGRPDFASRLTLVDGAATPVDLEIGPDGDLFYVDIVGGTVRRIRYFDDNVPPVAALRAEPTAGPVPLTVALDASESHDPDGDPITFAWDLDDDGAFDDASGPTAERTFTTPGTRRVRVRVRDPDGAGAVADVEVEAGNNPPVPTIETSVPPIGFAVGDVVTFAGTAVDPEDGPLPASALGWSLRIEHCPGSCHTHTVEEFEGVAGGSFSAPDHEAPSHLVLRLTATDAGGLSASVEVALVPRTVVLRFETIPPGLTLGAGAAAEPVPFTRTVAVGATTQVSAPSPQTHGGREHVFVGWSDGGAPTHDVLAGETDATLVATYAALCAGHGGCADGDACTDDRCTDGRCASTPRTCAPGDACREAACDPATGACVPEPLGSDGAQCLLRSALAGPCDPAALTARLRRRLERRLVRAADLLEKALVTSGPKRDRRWRALDRTLARLLRLTGSRAGRRLPPACRAHLEGLLDEVRVTAAGLHGD
jgi:glucose/arabinose dehydrogenase/PKD repeat protein